MLNYYKNLIKIYLQLIRFDKPIGTLLLLWPTLSALFIAQGKVPELKYIVVFSLGTFLTRSAGCVFNDLADSNFDMQVSRTKNRPLAQGLIKKSSALYLAISLSLIAFILAILTLSTNTILLAVIAAIIYITYPLFKRFFPIPQLYLGIAFSFGILMAFMQIQGKIPNIAWILFIGNLFWTIAYDTIYALVDIGDDLKIGIKTSAITFGRLVTPIISICYTIFILSTICVGIKLQLNYIYYLCIFIATVLILRQISILMNKNRQLYFRMFLSNNKIGLVIFLGIVSNYL